MQKIIVMDARTIVIGRAGENGAAQVVWPGILAKWRGLYGEGTVQLAARRPGDKEPYPAVCETDGDDVTWTVSAGDTGRAGIGECELSYLVGNTVAKSQTWATMVLRSLTGDGTAEPPEPYQSWVDEVLKETSDLRIQGVPEGGTTGQVLTKTGDEDFDTGWETPVVPEMPKQDWNQNDPESINYIKNRTHYVEGTDVVVAQTTSDSVWNTKWIQSRNDGYVVNLGNASLTLGESYDVSFNGKIYTLECTQCYTLQSGYYIGLNIEENAYDTPESPTAEIPFSVYVQDEADYWKKVQVGEAVSGDLRVTTIAEYAGLTPPIDVTITKPNQTFHPLDSRYLPDSAILLDSETSSLKSPTGTDVSQGVRAALGVEDKFVINLTEGDDGTLTADKTYEEIMKAFQSGKYLMNNIVTRFNWIECALIEWRGNLVFSYSGAVDTIGAYVVSVTYILAISEDNIWSIRGGYYSGLMDTESPEDLIMVLNHEKSIWDAVPLNSIALPAVTEADNGKILKVVNGQWELVDEVPL